MPRAFHQSHLILKTALLGRSYFTDEDFEAPWLEWGAGGRRHRGGGALSQSLQPPSEEKMPGSHPGLIKFWG